MTTETNSNPPDVVKALTELHNACGKALAASTGGEHAARFTKSYVFVDDLQLWGKVLHERPEIALHKTALPEYTTALLNLAQAQYRNAFKGLRLVLELTLQATFASTNLLELKEWLSGGRHTSWARIMNKEDGLFSKRLCKMFFEELSDESSQFRTIAETVYTELSECIHGNTDRLIPLPTSFEYDASTVSVWLEKSETIQRVIQFALCMRYLKELSADSKAQLEASIVDQIGHLSSIRSVLGGVVEA
jgi:hypothetical protein